MFVNILNPDADVAQYNITRYQQAQNDLSTRYVNELSEDAVPILVNRLNQTSGIVQDRIRNDLSRRLARMESNKNWQNWPSFHLSRWQAYDELKRLQARGELK